MSNGDRAVVYAIRLIGTENVYVGSTVQFRKRTYQHKSALRRGAHHARYLQRAWNKFGGEAFAFEILEEFDRESLTLSATLIDRETYWMRLLKSVYNHGLVGGSNLGAKLPSCSAERKAKTAAAQKGKKRGPGWKWTLEQTTRRLATRGYVKTPGNKKPRSTETLAKLSATLRDGYANGRVHPRLGVAHTDESNAKNAAAHMGRKASAETRAKMSAAHKKRAMQN